jgi:hypothetical protein
MLVPFDPKTGKPKAKKNYTDAENVDMGIKKRKIKEYNEKKVKK